MARSIDVIPANEAAQMVADGLRKDAEALRYEEARRQALHDQAHAWEAFARYLRGEG